MVFSFGNRFPRSMRRIKQCNILVIGNTGIGKSTLISHLFQIPISNDVTQTISKYTKSGTSIAVYDTPGLEKDNKQRNKVRQEIANLIKQQNQKEPEEQIHAVWYCVSFLVTREKEIEEQWIKSLSKELPIIAVITRASGVEREWLQPYLKRMPHIKSVVPVMAKRETTRNGYVEPYGLNSLLSATEELLNNMAQEAIIRSVNAKADKAFAWCRDGCAKVLTAQLMPIPFFKSPLSSGLQVWMLADISKTFGHQFDQSILAELCTVGLGAVGFDSFIEEALKNLPGIDYDNMQTVKDVLSHFTTMLEHAAGTLPYKEQLLEMLKHVSDSGASGLPVLTCLTAIATTLSTGFLAVSYIETMKIYKTAEYEGQPMPELREVLIEQMQLLMEFINPFLGRKASSGFA